MRLTYRTIRNKYTENHIYTHSGGTCNMILQTIPYHTIPVSIQSYPHTSRLRSISKYAHSLHVYAHNDLIRARKKIISTCTHTRTRIHDTKYVRTGGTSGRRWNIRSRRIYSTIRIIPVAYNTNYQIVHISIQLILIHTPLDCDQKYIQ